ncbi:MAG: ribosome-associated translation inhibitor RaiA [Verrucomicrobia bacterium]|nr:ribosome-associated translation inhibitor RaiA [Verrucomicrobiota bacterium]
MELILDSHNVELTEAIKEHVGTCIHKLEHMNQRALEARVNLERDHVGLPENKFKCTMHVYFKGADIFAEDHENDLYAAIDLVTKKIQQQLRKRHNKIITRHHAGAAKAKRARQLTDA